MLTARVFVSSNQEHPENFLEERRIAREIITTFRFLDAWIFEAEGASSETLQASYLEPLRDSVIVVLILGEHLTQAVRAEYEEAKKLGKEF